MASCASTPPQPATPPPHTHTETPPPRHTRTNKTHTAAGTGHLPKKKEEDSHAKHAQRYAQNVRHTNKA